jgi:hypothetical protein
MAEVLIKRRGVKRLVQLGTGEQSDEVLKLPAGRYTVEARPLTEGNVPSAAAIGTARLRVVD